MKPHFTKIIFSCLLLGLYVTPSWALVAPKASRFDTRIQVIQYNSHDVVKLNGVPGIATEIVLERDEAYVAHAFGDPNAWEFTHVGHYVFLKPKAENGDTNLVIVTTKRSYHFELHYLANPKELTTYQLSFRYPEEEATQRNATLATQTLNQAFSQPVGPINLNYYMTKSRKSRAIAPTHVWDDGRFTYFQFPGNRDLPTVYVINSDGSEAIVNRYNQGKDNNTLVLENVAPQWVVRLGSHVVGVVNRDFHSDGIANLSRTRSSSVLRVVKRSEP